MTPTSIPTPTGTPVRVLFVCMGNICRSPTAEGVFRALVEREGLAERIRTDSAGTHAYHIGSPPDPRSQAAARKRGVDLSDLRGRQTKPHDFDAFDYLLAMDRDNHRNLLAIAPAGGEGKVRLFLEFAEGLNIREVPDPYYGGGDGFERVLDMIEAASQGFLDHIRRTHF